MSEARYDGVCSANDWWTRHASLNFTLADEQEASATSVELE